jgi:hypothetical protein
MRLDIVQYASVLLALLLYGLFGQPTPDKVGVIELIIALLLLIGAGVHGLSAVFVNARSAGAPPRPAWFSAGQFFAVFGLSVPFFIALAGGADIKEVARDLIAFGFLLLPLLYVHLFRDARGFRRLFMFGVVFIGVAFSARIFLPLALPQFGLPSAVALYLTITPAVLFAALYLLAASFLRISWRRGDVIYNVFYGLFAALIALLPIFALSYALQRASFAALVLFAVAGLFYILLYRPETALRLVALLAVLVFAFLPQLQDIIMRLELKHVQVGFNSRGAELQAILQLGTRDLGHFLFGHGWGALFENPAVGKMHVGYTHNLFSYYFFKTGLVGLALLVIYWGAIFRENLRLVRINLPLGLSLMLPILISSFFYASHKAFSFGLLLLLVCAIMRRRVDAPSASTVEQG